MVRNSLGRLIPKQFAGKMVQPYQDPFSRQPQGIHASRPLRRVNPGESKLRAGLREAIEAAGLKDGMCIATHHHLRNGDLLLGEVVRQLDRLGLRDIRIASSSESRDRNPEKVEATVTRDSPGSGSRHVT